MSHNGKLREEYLETNLAVLLDIYKKEGFRFYPDLAEDICWHEDLKTPWREKLFPKKMEEMGRRTMDLEVFFATLKTDTSKAHFLAYYMTDSRVIQRKSAPAEVRTVMFQPQSLVTS